MPKPKTADNTQAPSALDSIPEDQRPGVQENKSRRIRAWCVARIVDYRFQVLVESDPENPGSDLEFGDVSLDAFISLDREEAYQTARDHDGLLMSCAGMPGGARMTAFQAKVKELVDKATPPREPRRTERELPRASGDSSRQYKPQVPAADDDDVPF